MQFTTLAFISLALPSALAGPTPKPKRLPLPYSCSGQTSHSGMPLNILAARNAEPLRDAGSEVQIHWAIISKDDTLIGGQIPDEKLDEQMQILNSDFAQVGLTFKIVNKTRIRNEEWFERRTQDYQNVFAHITDPSILKVWSLNPGSSDSPVADTGTPASLSDGINFGVIGLPNFEHFITKGHTLAHEIGHWSGLFHTFTNHCNSPGDKVEDTPPQSEESIDQCEKPVFSACGGTVPIATDNFMNYVPDGCRKRFTPGQIERMRTNLKQFRGITLGAPTDPGTASTNSTSTSGTKTGNNTDGTAGWDGSDNTVTDNTAGDTTETPTGANRNTSGGTAGETGGTSGTNDVTDSAGETGGTTGGTGSTLGGTTGENGGTTEGTGSTPGSMAGGTENTSGGTENTSGGTRDGNTAVDTAGDTGGTTSSTDETGSTGSTQDVRAKARQMFTKLQDATSNFWEFMNKNQLL